jgi:ribosomal protein S18 acetylase RimI-like enzyme
MVEPTEHRAVGREYLDTLTRLLQDARLADANGGLWEAADIQWWWRVDQHEDRGLQCFWTYGSTPVVAASFTNWGAGYGCDLFGTDAEVAAHSGLLWDFVRDAMPDGRIEMIIADDDHTRIDAAEAAGFVATDDLFAGARMAAGRRPRAIRSPDGYTLVSYRGGAHWMVGRNGAEVAMRLAECSLYDADLDLAVLAADGSVAGYALFWADPVTGVGLLEPMRVEAGHQGRGLGRMLLTAGLERLAAKRCDLLRVGFEIANEPARRLYTGAGFRPYRTSRTYVRPAISAR